jgi:peptide/nickel transport system ATP-binding protein/oligopeptide transport system ATP-binding protein
LRNFQIAIQRRHPDKEMTDDILLQVNDLHTNFYTDEGVVKAVDGVDFFVRRGETLGLVGESGCGKSVTALSIMRLIQQPPGRIEKGQILFENQDLLRMSEEHMRQIRGNHISMIFQEPMTSLNPVFRVGDQIAEAIQLHQGLSRGIAMERAVEMLQKVGIPDPKTRVKEYPHQMSGGMRQRVMIAMALSCNPKMMIADEPTTALDVTIQAQILELMNKLKEDFGASILLITHDLGVIADMAQSVAVMYTGKIVEYADVVELFTRPKHPYTIALMESIPNMDEPVPEDRMLQTIPGIVPSLLDLPTGCSFRERCSQGLDLCGRKNPSLIEVEPGHLVRCWHYGQP